MKIGEAIQQLQALQEQHGDVDIAFFLLDPRGG